MGGLTLFCVSDIQYNFNKKLVILVRYYYFWVVHVFQQKSAKNSFGCPDILIERVDPDFTPTVIACKHPCTHTLPHMQAHAHTHTDTHIHTHSHSHMQHTHTHLHALSVGSSCASIYVLGMKLQTDVLFWLNYSVKSWQNIKQNGCHVLCRSMISGESVWEVKSRSDQNMRLQHWDKF